MLTDNPCTLRRRRRSYTVIWLAAFLSWLPAADAIEVESLYQAEVPLEPSDPDARQVAYERALEQVLVRVTGSEGAAFSPELKALFPNPARFVLQFRPGEGDTLWVSFDGAAIERVLRARGLPVWGKDRPLTVVWLAVDWGQGDRELLAAAPPYVQPSIDLRAARRSELRERIERVAAARGIPVVFPDLDNEVSTDVSFVDVWGGFHERLKEASRRYGASSVLVGRLRTDVAQRNRWSYYFGGNERQWSGDPEETVHLLADTLAGEFAFVGDAPLEDVMLTVTNVNSVRDYAAVQKLIGGLQLIKEYRLDAVNGDRVRYAVRINGGRQRLASALDFDGRLERYASPEDGFGTGEPGGLSYAYRP